MSLRTFASRARRNPIVALGLAAIVAPLLLPWSTAAHAAEAYVQNGIGARNKALAGAGVASSTDATAASLNPAGLVNVGSGLALSFSFLDLDGGYWSGGIGGINADGYHASEPGWTIIPNLAVSWRVDWGLLDAIAFTAYANGGVSTRYKDVANTNCPVGLSGVFCGGPMGIKLEQSFYSVAFAKQLLPGLSVGVAPIVARQVAKIEGVSLFGGLSSDPANFSNRGTDESWGVGVRGGIEWMIRPGLRVGIAGNAPINMSNFDKYAGLLAERGDFDVPGTLQAGVAVDVAHNLTLLADYKRIWFSSVASASNPTTNLFAFGADNGPGYGVRDVDVYKIGLEWRRSPALTLRAGYSYNTAPIGSRDADLNIMTLGVVQHHFTGGLKYEVTRNLDIELSAMYAPRATVSGTELYNPLRDVTIDMSQLEFTIGAIYRFGDAGRPLK